MAIIPNGILGEFIGTAGNISGYMLNGRNIIRTRRRRSGKTMSSARIAQQQKIKVCNDFTKSFSGTGFFNKSFPANGHPGSGYNRATSAIMNRAIVGTYPDISIAYPLVFISGGQLPTAENVFASGDAQSNIIFTWNNNSGTGSAKANDKVILVAYFPELKEVIFSTGAATRANGSALLDTHIMQGHTAETWIGFLSNDEEDAADSVYAGNIVL